MHFKFDNHFVNALPADPRLDIQSRSVIGAAFSRVQPTVVAAPRTLAIASEVADQLAIPESERHDPAFAEVFSGNRLLPGMDPYAACYGGHQFGNWAGQLGDGRAITLGEVVAPSGRWEIQLKGAGPTPYSRRADGRAVLRSSIREFLCSEAMFHLGVPTTRALSIVSTGDTVVRDMFYDGNPRGEPGAIVCRVAPSFLRFGNYELPTSRQDHTLLQGLVEYTLTEFYPHLGPLNSNAVVELLHEVCNKTIDLITHWMRVGFVHGVMNTDNLSILGLTIDYGPYGWLEPYDPNWTPNTTDVERRRYRYGNQPAVALWNLARLAEAFYPLVGDAAPLEKVLADAVTKMEEEQLKMLRTKLGLRTAHSDDTLLIRNLFLLFGQAEIDMTLFFRGLADLRLEQLGESDEQLLVPIQEAWYSPISVNHKQQTAQWLRAYLQRLVDEGSKDGERRKQMNAVNPRYVLRNYLAQLAIERAEADDPTGIHELLDVLRHPYEEQPGKEEFARRRPEWARHRPGCSALSCSS